MSRLWAALAAYPRSLTGQIATLIAVALFVAQAVNLALLVGERRELRFEQAVRPSVVRLVDAAERLTSNRPLAGPGDAAARGRRARVTAGNPLAGPHDPEPEVVEAVTFALREAALPHGRIVAGVRPLPPRDERLATLPPHRAERLRRRAGELLVAVELPGRGWLSVRSGWPRDGFALIWRLIGQTLIIYAIILLPVLWLGRRIARPLKQLTAAARDFAPGAQHPPLAPSGPADVRALIGAWNTLGERVLAMLDEKDRMLGAIGHDLRTPLAALRVRIETAEDDADRARMADTIDEMNRTLDDILSLARLGRPSEPARAVDIGALVDAVVDDFRALGAPVELYEVPRIVREVRPALMRRAVRNLVENAVKYGGGAEVFVSADNAVRISVRDNGPGIPAPQFDAVFDPFTRLEHSRNRDTGGIGLGLALARGIAREAGGEIILANREGGGLQADIVLPTRR